MNVERGRFEGEETPEEAAAGEARMAAVIEKARRDPRYAHLFDAVDDEAAIATARADVEAGRVVPHEEVMKWLKTWGTSEAGPPPREWFE